MSAPVALSDIARAAAVLADPAGDGACRRVAEWLGELARAEMRVATEKPKPRRCRTLTTQERYKQRDALFRQIAEKYYQSNKTARRAQLIAAALDTYVTRSWCKRDCDELECPTRHRGHKEELFWHLCRLLVRMPRIRDKPEFPIPDIRTMRRILATT
jgi:hypothetical protein